MTAVALSCGVLVFDADGALLLGHATGTPRWDIPKGLCEAGETEREAAARETYEETGLVLAPDDLFDLGRHRYLRGKDLHLFAALVGPIEPKRFSCSTRFLDPHGRSRPEMDAYAWVAVADVPARCGKSLARLLGEALSPVDVWRALRESAERQGPTRWSLRAG